jgi:hypothetical protein
MNFKLCLLEWLHINKIFAMVLMMLKYFIRIVGGKYLILQNMKAKGISHKSSPIIWHRKLPQKHLKNA